MNFLAQGLKNSYVFSKKTFSYISGGNFQSLKNKKKVYSDKISYISPEKNFFSWFGMTADQTVK